MIDKSEVELAALNIVMHPHSPEKYGQLWKAAFGLNRVLKLRGDQWGLVGSCDPASEGNQEVIEGEIHKFLHIDPSEPWMNLLKLDEASEDDLATLNIPKHLKPNKSSFRYAFFPKAHKLVFQTLRDGKTLGPTSVHRFVEALLNDNKLAIRFPKVDVQLEQSKQHIENFLKRRTLKSLVIVVSKPNPDGLAQEEEEVFEEMEKEHARKKKVEIVAEKDENLTPSQQTLKLARVAASNGSVSAVAEGEDEQNIHFETKDHPVVESFTYDKETEGLVDTFRREAAKLISRIRG